MKKLINIIPILVVISFAILGCNVEKKRILPQINADSIKNKQTLRYEDYDYTISDYALKTYKNWGYELHEFFDKSKYLDKPLGILLNDLKAQYSLIKGEPEKGEWIFENFRYGYSYYFSEKYYYAIIIYVGSEGNSYLNSKPYNLKYLEELLDWDVIQYWCDIRTYKQRSAAKDSMSVKEGPQKEPILHKIDSIAAARRDANAINSVVIPRFKNHNPMK